MSDLTLGLTFNLAAVAAFGRLAEFALSENSVTLLGVAIIGACGALGSAWIGTRNQRRLDTLERRLREENK